MSGEEGEVELWIEHDGARINLPVSAAGQVSLPDRADLIAADPPLQSSLDAAYLRPGALVAPIRPPREISAELIKIYGAQMDGIVEDFAGPVLAALVPGFDRVALATEARRPRMRFEIRHRSWRAF